MTATLVLDRAMGPVLSVAGAPLDAPVSSGDELPDPTRDFFAACHTVTPPAPYTPAYGPWRAGRTLAETVAWLAYTLEGA